MILTKEKNVVAYFTDKTWKDFAEFARANFDKKERVCVILAAYRKHRG